MYGVPAAYPAARAAAIPTASPTSRAAFNAAQAAVRIPCVRGPPSANPRASAIASRTLKSPGARTSYSPTTRSAHSTAHAASTRRSSISTSLNLIVEPTGGDFSNHARSPHL